MGKLPSTAPLQLRAAVASSACPRRHGERHTGTGSTLQVRVADSKACRRRPSSSEARIPCAVPLVCSHAHQK